MRCDRGENESTAFSKVQAKRKRRFQILRNLLHPSHRRVAGEGAGLRKTPPERGLGGSDLIDDFGLIVRDQLGKELKRLAIPRLEVRDSSVRQPL